MHSIIPFQKRKPTDIEPYIDKVKGWKFTENDKEFLLNFLRRIPSILHGRSRRRFCRGNIADH